MSPNTCCWMFELARLTILIDVVTLSSSQRKPAPALTSVYGSVVPWYGIVEHVLPERFVGVGDREVAEELAQREAGADVEPVVRRQVQLGQGKVLRVGIALIRVVGEDAGVAVDGRVDAELDALARALAEVQVREGGRQEAPLLREQGDDDRRQRPVDRRTGSRVDAVLREEDVVFQPVHVIRSRDDRAAVGDEHRSSRFRRRRATAP